MKRRLSGYLRVCLFLQVSIVLVTAVLVPGGAYASESRIEFACGDTVFGQDTINNGMAQLLFHDETVARSSDGALAIDFLAGPSGPAPSGLAVSPAIAQTSTDTIAATGTGFFASNFLFSPVTNVGAVPVGVGQFGKASPVAPAAFSGTALLYPEMVVRGNLLGKGDLPNLVRAGFSFPPAQAVVANDTIWKLGKIESERNALGFNAIDKGLPVILSAHNFDFVSTPAQISKTSIVERLWRNTHQGAALDFLYEGDTAYPEWIAPIKNPLQLIDCGEGSKAITSALDMTRPGRFLTRSFWSL